MTALPLAARSARLTSGVYGVAVTDPPTLHCSDTASGGSKSMDVFLGDMLIVGGQVVMAFQVGGVLERLVTVQWQ